MPPSIEQLRDLLHSAPPSARLFDRLASHIPADNTLPTLTLDYLREHLASWPETINRTIPSHWLRTLLQRAPCPQAALCNQLAPSLNAHPPKIGDDGAHALISSPDLTSITSLNLSSTDLGPSGVTALIASPSFAKVRSLVLAHNPLRDSPPFALVASPMRHSLRFLHLSDTKLSNDGLTHLLTSTQLPSLTHLNLARNSIDFARASVLLHPPPPSHPPNTLSQLHTLDLSGHVIPKHLHTQLSNAPHLQTIPTLRLPRYRL